MDAVCMFGRGVVRHGNSDFAVDGNLRPDQRVFGVNGVG